MPAYINAHKLCICFCFEAIKDLIYCEPVPLCLYKSEFVCVYWYHKEVSLILFCAFLTVFSQLMTRCCFSYAIWGKRCLCNPAQPAWRLNCYGNFLDISVSSAVVVHSCLLLTNMHTFLHPSIPQVLPLQLSTLLGLMIWPSCISCTFFSFPTLLYSS